MFQSIGRGLFCLLLLSGPLRAAELDLEAGTKLEVIGGGEAETLNLRAEPRAASSVLEELPRSAVITATGRTKENGDDTWVEVEHGTARGWVNAHYVGRAHNAASSEAVADEHTNGPKPGTVFRIEGAQKLNLRSEPDPSAQALEEMSPEASKLEATGRAQKYEDNLWIEVRVNGKAGWVNSRFVREVTSSESSTATTDDAAHYIDDVRTKLTQQEQYLSGEHYQRVQTEHVDAVDHGTSTSLSLQLEAAVTYAWVAACDQDCSHVQLALFDDKHNLVAQSSDDKAVIIIKGALQTPGSYTAELTVPGCSEERCHAGLLLMKLEEGAAEKPAQQE